MLSLDRPPAAHGTRPIGRAWRFRARQILAPSGSLLDDGAVWGRGDCIAGVGSWSEARRIGSLPPGGEDIDVGEALVLPAFVNAHAHLELGFLQGKIPPGLSFCQWLERIIQHTRGASPEVFRDSVTRGIEEIRSQGCAFVGDIVRRLPPRDEPPHPAGPLEFFLFWEMIDFDEHGVTERVRAVVERAESFRRPGVEPGLSPHAPYTTTLALLRETARVAGSRIPLCIHCDETEEEHRLWLRGDGPLREFLDGLPAFPEGWQPPGCTPVEWLDRAGILAPPTASRPPVLLVHGNALEDRDLEILARRHCAAVVCPGTHLYFQRSSFPLARLLRAGIPTALGTDGLSSNDRLSMWEEIRRCVRLVPDLSSAQAIGFATSGAARVLGIEHRYGSIAPGHRAAFAVVDSPFPAPPLDTPQGRDWVLSPASRVRDLLVLS